MYLSKSYEWFQLPGSDGGAVSTVVLPSKVKVKILPKKVIKQIWINKQVNEEKIFCLQKFHYTTEHTNNAMRHGSVGQPYPWYTLYQIVFTWRHGAMLVCRKNPKGIELFPNVKHFSLFFQEICTADGPVSEKDLYEYATAGQINLKKKQLLQKKGPCSPSRCYAVTFGVITPISEIKP